ncbi:MAG: nucleotidyltransferase family protein, partial [Acholeplasmataceae bacterium]|nr:nucleotidyltransferase family protein [Acholeplasmataceae bacterium]
MKKTFNEIFSAVKCALNQEKYIEPISNEKAFYVMSLENGLSGIIYSAIDKYRVSELFHKRLERNFYDYVSRDIKQVAAIKYLDDLLNEHHIDHVFLKGSRLKTIYPESYMRAMGDIDILVKEDKMKDVHHLFKDKEIICTSRSKQHDVFEMKNKLMIEIHPYLYKDFNLKYKELFSDVWKYTIHMSDSRYEFTHEFEIIYLLYHLAKHLDSGGIGLRSVLDIGIYLSRFEATMDEEIIEEYLRLSDMKKFYQSMVDMNRKCFGLNYQMKLNTEFEMDQDTFVQVTEFIAKSGVHGIGREFNVFQSRLASEEMKNKSKFKYVVRIFFPSYESMCG